MDNHKVFAMPFAKVDPLYVAKAEKKGRTKDEVENVQAPLRRETRYLDKLIDELARGKTMQKVLRSEAE